MATGEGLKATVYMVEAAYIRILASGAAHGKAKGQFPGVRDMRRKKAVRRRARSG